jgi:hypothetical protein
MESLSILKHPGKNCTTLVLLLFGLLLSGCQNLELSKLVKIKTGEYLDLTASTVTLTGELVDAGETGVLKYGFCWATSIHPTPDNYNFISGGLTLDSKPFQAAISGLTWNTAYYFRAFCEIASNQYMYGEEKVFTTPYDAVLYKLPPGVVPLIDGEIDAVWDNVEKNHISRNFYGSVPSIDSAYWKAAWNDYLLFVLIVVCDDIHLDRWDIDGEEWDADKTEIYIDVNSILKDGIGPAEGSFEYPCKPYGHYQVAPAWQKSVNAFHVIDSSWQDYSLKYEYAYQLDEPDYIFEYAVKWNSLKDKNGIAVDPLLNNREFGLDVTIIDRDYIPVPRQFKVWRNAGGPSFDETYDYYNMDGAGVIVLSKEEINYP